MQFLAKSQSYPMVPSSSPRQPPTILTPLGPSTPQVDARSGRDSTALDALTSQVQRLVADQALSQQQVQQMYASQATVQRQMQALITQLQNPAQPPIASQA